MYDELILKEIKESKEANTKFIGRYVIDVLCKTENGDNFKNKSLKECMAKIREQAKEMGGNCVMVDGNTVLEWVNDYFNITPSSGEMRRWYTASIAPDAPPPEVKKTVKPTCSDDLNNISLLDLL